MKSENIRRGVVAVISIGLLAILVAACAKRVPVPSLYIASFAYSAPKSEAAQGISIAIVNPQYSQRMGQPCSGDTIQCALGSALSRSLLEYFTASGFSVSGPFKKPDDMTFPEKKQADLILSTEIDLNHSFPSIAKKRGPMSWWDGSIVYESSGKCSVSGSISFVMWEPMSMQRMWAKSVDIPAKQVGCNYRNQSTSQHLDNNILNSTFKLYEEIFGETMKTAERYFNPEEVALIKKQSQELREKKVY